MAHFINKREGSNELTNTVYNNTTTDITTMDKDIVTKNMTLIEKLDKNDDIGIFLESILNVETSMIHRLSYIHCLAQKYDILPLICDSKVLDIGDFQYLYVNVFINMHNDNNIDVELLKKIYLKMAEHHNTQIILGMLTTHYLKYGNSILDLYCEIDISIIPHIIFYMIKQEPKILDSKLLDYCKDHAIFKQDKHGHLLALIFSKYDNMDTLYNLFDELIKYAEIDVLNTVITHSANNNNELLFIELHKKIDEYKCISEQIFNKCILAIKKDIVSIMRLTVDQSYKINLIDELKNCNDMNVIKFVFENNLLHPYDNKSKLLMKSLFCENVALTTYILENYEPNADAKKIINKMKKIIIDENLKLILEQYN